MSIIGNSVIYAQALTVTGPTGNIGPIGLTGAKGATGITLGPTGASGIFIRDTISNLNDNTITFVLSNNSNIELFGFTGPNISYFNSAGLSSAYGSGTIYYPVFIGVSGGITFNFRGICGDGQYVIASLSPDRSEVLLTVNPLGFTFPFGVSNSNYLPYINSNEQVSSSKIRAISYTEDTDPGFSTDPNSYIEFGLTGTTPASAVRTFTELSTVYVNVSSIGYDPERSDTSIGPGIVGTDSGGYILNLDDASVFKLTTPIGITSFHYTKSRSSIDTNSTNDISSWLFFIEGSDVWNLPDNLKFTDNINGIGGYAFTKGMNILKITKSSINPVYHATFIDRFIGNDEDVSYRPIGSCTSSDGVCIDYFTEQACEDSGGTFKSLQTCDTQILGRCCLGTGSGDCRDGITENVCVLLGGSWSLESCSPNVCVPFTPSYSIQNIQYVKNISNAITATDTLNAETIIKFDAVVSNYPGTNLRLVLGNKDSTESGAPNTSSFTLDRNTSIQPVTIGLSGGTPVSDNVKKIDNGVTPFEIICHSETISGFPEQFTQPDTLTFKPVFRDASSSPPTTVAISTIGITAEYVISCGGNIGYHKIKSEFIAENWCRDCFTSVAGNEIRKPVQDVHGTFDFCVNPQTLDIKKNCVNISTVYDRWDCKNSDMSFATGNPNSRQCVHLLYQLGVNGTGTPCVGGDCSEGGQDGTGTVCKGADTSESKGYWNTVKLKNENRLLYDLAELGITLNDSITVANNVLKLIEGITGPIVNESIFFNPNNIQIGLHGSGSEQKISWSTNTNCCEPEIPYFPVSTLLSSIDTTTYRYFVYHFLQSKTLVALIGCCSVYNNFGLVGEAQPAGSTDSLLYTIIHRVEKTNLDSDGNLIDQSNPGCFETIPTGSTPGCNNGCRWGASCPGGGGSSKSWIERFGPYYVGEITSSELSGGNIQIVSCNETNADYFSLNTCGGYSRCADYSNTTTLTNWKTILHNKDSSTISKPNLAFKNDTIKTHWALNNICACDAEIYNYCGSNPTCETKKYCDLNPFAFDPSYKTTYCNSLKLANSSKRIIILKKAPGSNTASAGNPFETWNVFVYKFNGSSWVLTGAVEQTVWYLAQPSTINDDVFFDALSDYPANASFTSAFGNGAPIQIDRRKDFNVYITSGNNISPETSPVLFQETLPAISNLDMEFSLVKNGSLWIKSDVGTLDNSGTPNSCNLRIEAGLDCESGTPCTFDNFPDLEGWELGRWQIYLRYPSSTPVILRGAGNWGVQNIRNTYPITEWFDITNWTSTSNNNVLNTCGTFETGGTETAISPTGQPETLINIYANAKLLFRRFNFDTGEYDYINKFYYTQVRIPTNRDVKSTSSISNTRNILLKDPNTGISQNVLIDCSVNPVLCLQ